MPLITAIFFLEKPDYQPHKEGVSKLTLAFSPRLTPTIFYRDTISVSLHLVQHLLVFAFSSYFAAPFPLPRTEKKGESSLDSNSQIEHIMGVCVYVFMCVRVCISLSADGPQSVRLPTPPTATQSSYLGLLRIFHFLPGSPLRFFIMKQVQ